MKKKFYQKKWFIALVCLFVIGIIGSTSSEDNTSTDTQVNTEVEQNTDNTEKQDTEQELSRKEQFIESVKVEIQGAISSDDEKITEVTLTNGELRVFVDLSQADPTPLTLEDLAIARTTSITDSILDLTEYENLWNLIVVDFGELGSISNMKEEMVQNEYGYYYFPTENFELEK